jgi:hypothetical protein
MMMDGNANGDAMRARIDNHARVERQADGDVSALALAIEIARDDRDLRTLHRIAEVLHDGGLGYADRRRHDADVAMLIHDLTAELSLVIRIRIAENRAEAFRALEIEPPAHVDDRDAAISLTRVARCGARPRPCDAAVRDQAQAAARAGHSHPN